MKTMEEIKAKIKYYDSLLHQLSCRREALRHKKDSLEAFQVQQDLRYFTEKKQELEWVISKD